MKQRRVYTGINHTSLNLKNCFTDSDDDGAITEPPAKTMEIMYGSDEDFIYPKPTANTKTETKTKDSTKDIIKTKPIA